MRARGLRGDGRRRPGNRANLGPSVGKRQRERGQATVELALVLPLLALLSLALVEFGLVVRDQVLVAHAAREAARAAAVGDDAAAAAFTGTGLRDLRVVVSGGATVGTARTVTVERTEGGHLPLFGRLSAGFTLRASAAMRFEGPP